jgi:hypothetical protein
MANRRSFCYIIAFHKFATLENRLTYQCPSSWPVFITMTKKLAGTWKKKKKKGCWPVRINSNKFATGQILKKSVDVEKGRILAGWAQKSSKHWLEGREAMFKFEALIRASFWRALKFQLFSWRVGSNPRRRSKNIEMKYKTHIKLVHRIIWYMFPVQWEELRINRLTLFLVVTTLFACWFLWWAYYSEDFERRPHFQIGVAIWRVVLREVYFEFIKIYPNLIKGNQRMSTCNRLDLQTLGSQLVMPKKSPRSLRGTT